MKKYITTDGKTCRSIDEPNSPLLNLTKEMPIGEMFDGEDVWQYQQRGELVWQVGEPPKSMGFENWSNQMFNLYDAATRIAIEPIEKPLEGEETPAIDAGETVEEIILAGLTINEAYLHGAIAGQRKRIKQLEESLKGYVRVDEVVALIDNKITEISIDGQMPFTAHVLEGIIPKIKNLTK